jgi:hypothetical protein
MPEPTPDAWAQIRYAYEHTDRPVDDICLEHGTTANTLRYRARRWGWTMRRPPIPAEGPPPLNAPPAETYGPQRADPQGEPLTTPLWLPPSPTLSGEGSSEASGGEKDIEPSPHISVIKPTAADTAPIGQRLQGAVSRVLPAIETTLAKLAAGPMRPREMELAARALGSLTRTLRELNGLLAQHKADEPAEDVEEMRRDLARKIEAIIAQEREETPRRYLAGWEEFAAAEDARMSSDDAEAGLEE